MITFDAHGITDAQIAALRDAACECRPKLPPMSDDHAVSHDCDVDIYDSCIYALRGDRICRKEIADFANKVVATHGPDSAYYRALLGVCST